MANRLRSSESWFVWTSGLSTILGKLSILLTTFFMEYVKEFIVTLIFITQLFVARLYNFSDLIDDITRFWCIFIAYVTCLTGIKYRSWNLAHQTFPIITCLACCMIKIEHPVKFVRRKGWRRRKQRGSYWRGRVWVLKPARPLEPRISDRRSRWYKAGLLYGRFRVWP